VVMRTAGQPILRHCRTEALRDGVNHWLRVDEERHRRTTMTLVEARETLLVTTVPPSVDRKTLDVTSKTLLVRSKPLSRESGVFRRHGGRRLLTTMRKRVRSMTLSSSTMTLRGDTRRRSCPWAEDP
jgi:hypothetical protein